MEPKKIVIKTVLNGWRVKVGCQEVVFTDKQDMLDEISMYLDDPESSEKNYQQAVNYRFFEYAKAQAYGYTFSDIIKDALADQTMAENPGKNK